MQGSAHVPRVTSAAVLTALLVVGSVGLLFLLVGIVFGELLDGLLDVALPGDTGSGVIAAAGAALAAFGYGGALVLSTSELPVAAALLLSVGGAVVVGGVSYKASKALIGGPSTPQRASDLYGVFGSVVSAIPAAGFGEVTLLHAGERRKLSARAELPLPTGTHVHVIEILSETAVVVAPVSPVLPDPEEISE